METDVVIIMSIVLAVALSVLVYLAANGSILTEKKVCLSGRNVEKGVVLEVESIEAALGIENQWIAKYVCKARFFSRQNNKCWTSNTFIFYDKQDKYHVGDKLTLTLKVEENII